MNGIKNAMIRTISGRCRAGVGRGGTATINNPTANTTKKLANTALVSDANAPQNPIQIASLLFHEFFSLAKNNNVSIPKPRKIDSVFGVTDTTNIGNIAAKTIAAMRASFSEKNRLARW